MLEILVSRFHAASATFQHGEEECRTPPRHTAHTFRCEGVQCNMACHIMVDLAALKKTDLALFESTENETRGRCAAYVERAAAAGF